MTEYDNTNRGVLFKNDKKETDKHPDYKGEINIAGKWFWLSGWKRETKRGPVLSLAIKPKEAKPAEAGGPVAPRKSTKDELDDFIPFAPEFR